MPQGRNPRRAKDPMEATFGVRAAAAVLAKRPEDVARVVIDPAERERIEPALPRGARFEMADAGTIERLAESSHHEGICVIARPRTYLSLPELAEFLGKTKGTAIALDRVRNPYNVGAIVRTAAFFGVDALLLGAPAPHPGLHPTAIRVAEGGAEHVRLFRTTDLPGSLARLKAMGMHVVGAESDGAEPSTSLTLMRPGVIVVGNEREGLGERVRASCDELVKIEGGGAVHSLNVSIAASVLIAQLVPARR